MIDKESEILTHFDKIFRTKVKEHINLNIPLLNFLFEQFEEDLYTTNCEYKELLHKQIKVSSELENTFTEEQQKLFEQYWEFENQMYTVENEQFFYFGYIMANELNIERKLK